MTIYSELPFGFFNVIVTLAQALCNIRIGVIVVTVRVEPSVLAFLAFISKSVNNQCYNPYIFAKIFSRSFQYCMGCSIDCLAFSR